MSFIDYFLKITSVIAMNKFIILFIVLTGYTFLQKKIFASTFVIFSFSVLLNPFLKSLFKMPLPPTCPSTVWAFPSGHMFVAVIFWGWLSWELKNKYLYLFSAFILLCEGIALVHFGFHYPIDVVGALIFAPLTLCIYHFLLKLSKIKANPPILGLILALIGLILIFLTPNLTINSSKWISFASLVGFSLGWLLNLKLLPQYISSLKTKFAIFVTTIIGFTLLETIYRLTHVSSFSLKLTHFFILALWLSFLAPALILHFSKKKLELIHQ